MNFSPMKEAVASQFSKMLKGNVFLTNIGKDELWDTYINAFPEGTNPLFRERTEHDCNCCKRYIRAVGNAVAFVDNKLVTIWDVNVGGAYQVVADVMAANARSAAIKEIFLHGFKTVGVDKTPDNVSEIVWDHFYAELPNKFVKPKSTIATLKGNASNNYKVLKRSLTEITPYAVSTVLELIDTKAIYRGAEYRDRVFQLQTLQRDLDNTPNIEEFLWNTSITLGAASAFRNSAIGTLLVDLSKGEELEVAVKKYEAMVAPENYKRSSALITQAMINRAQDTIVELGLQESIQRRHAVIDDITINDVLFADRSAKKAMGVLDILAPTATKEVKIADVVEMSINDFMANILPNIDSMELHVENKHISNFVTLVAPIAADAPPITKWNNNFSWSYNGDIADSSMREEVKAKGGKVDGALRFSIQWNTPDRLYAKDLDAHCKAPSNEHINYSNKSGSNRSGTLDVDITRPNGIAVENIIYTDIARMLDGDYRFSVHNYSNAINKNGFTAEIEYAGQIFTFDHNESMRGSETVPVATVSLNKGNFSLDTGMPTSESTRECYGLATKQLHKVSMVMQSPNHWDCVDKPKGNKHFFFILDKCVNPEPVRGLYNEFLADSLHDHRKVFEVLGTKLKAPYSEEQLSGMGFSETQTNNVTVVVRGAINQTININFN